jgi:Domain of unknown function (DUF4349)
MIVNDRPIAGRLAVGLVVALTALAVVACAGSAGPNGATAAGVPNSNTGYNGGVPAPSAGALDLTGRDGSKPGATGSTSGGSQNGGSGGSPPNAPVDGAKIVRTGSLELQVADLAVAVATGHDKVVGLGGYVGQSRESNDGDRSLASVTYRIPVDRWDDARSALRRLAAKVVNEQTDAIEVTGQLIDLNARIDNLRASEKALQAILEKAAKVQDILDVEARLSDVRGQIEQLDAQRAHLSDQAALGTLAVTYRLPVVATVEAQKKWSPADEIDRATASLVDLLQAGSAAAIWFGIVWIPALIFLGIVIAIAVVIARRLGLRTRFDRSGVAGGEAA